MFSRSSKGIDDVVCYDVQTVEANKENKGRSLNEKMKTKRHLVRNGTNL